MAALLLFTSAMVSERGRMIDDQLVRRGITDPRVLDAFLAVPREVFVPESMKELAYMDSPLPIGERQTISQPYIVALTLQALALRGDERVLEIGTGSGYAAALLGRLARVVVSVERLASLADAARVRLAALGVDNVEVVVGDGSLGLPDHAPFDAIAVAAAGPRVPHVLREQLAVGGRLVMPVGSDRQHLVRVTRRAPKVFVEEQLLDVSFVPLIGVEAWPAAKSETAEPLPPADMATIVARSAVTFDDDALPLDGLVDRIGDARVVVIGGSLDGSAELVRARARLTGELCSRAGFGIVAVEADWDLPRNELFRGLDFLCTTRAVDVALERLAIASPERARAARQGWASVSPWRREVAPIFDAADRGLEEETVAILVGLLDERVEAARGEGRRMRDAILRACEVSEEYYRHLLRGTLEAWTIREEQMFLVLRALLDDAGRRSKAVVWTNDAHAADARAAETGVRGHETLGQLCRARFGRNAYLVGMGADHGAVLAAPSWGAPAARAALAPAALGSYEHLFHDTGLERLILPLRDADTSLRAVLAAPRLARCVGPIYAPERELATHYVHVSLLAAFDEYLFFDESSAVANDGVPPVAPARHGS